MSVFSIFSCRMRHNEMVLEREGQPNAPNPRESNPPCYADAVLMPRLKSSFISLKLASHASNDADNLMRRAAKRARSEEILGAARDMGERPILVARSRKRLDNWMNESSQSSAALIKNDSAIANDGNEMSFEIIPQFETEDGHSPYAKRKQSSTTVGHQGESSRANADDDPHTSQSYFEQCQTKDFDSPHSTLSPTPSSSVPSLSSFSSSSSVDSNNYVILPQRKRSESYYANV